MKFDNHLEMGGSAMIHCLRGSNRSGIVACAYLIGKCQTSATNALRHLQLVRPIVDVAEPAFGNRVLPGQWLQDREQLIMARFRDMGKTIVALPDTVSAHRLRSMVSLRCIRDRQAQGQPSRLSQEEEARLHKEIEQLKADSAEAKKEAERAKQDVAKLREEVGTSRASGQDDMTSAASGQVTAIVSHSGEALISSILRNDTGAVDEIIHRFSSDPMARHVAHHCSYNGMTALHCACRVVKWPWVEALLSWSPQVANATTFQESKPSKWTPLQCLVDNPLAGKKKDAVRIMEALVAHMSEEAVANQSGFTDKADGTRGGGMHCLHVLASRSSEHFWDLAEIIEHRFDRNVVVALLNVCTGDGRGVVDLALSTNVSFAKGIQKCYREAEPQRKRPDKDQWSRDSRRAWQPGDSDQKRGSPPWKRNKGWWPADDGSWWSSHSWW